MGRVPAASKAGQEAMMAERPRQHRVPTEDAYRPPWRLLVESADPALAISGFRAYRQAGFDVSLCEGPLIDERECPLVRGEGCPFAAEADVVLFDLGRDAQPRMAMLHAMLETRPDLPVVVRSAGPPPPGAEGLEVIDPSTSVAGQVAVLKRAAAKSTTSTNPTGAN
jgi:hypothetical protein